MINPIALKISVNDKVYIRDPQQTFLGKRIVTEGIKLMDELGMEKFTFKKLAERIQSTEASVYRYFENKNKFLIYLTSWYWSSLSQEIQQKTENSSDSAEKISVFLNVVCNPSEVEGSLLSIALLSKIVQTEAPKTYLLREVGELNRDQSYSELNTLTEQLAGYIREARPEYRFPKALASTILNAARQQQYLALNLPELTDIDANNTSDLISYLEQLIFVALERE